MGFFDVFRSRNKPPVTPRHPGQPDGKSLPAETPAAVPSPSPSPSPVAEPGSPDLAKIWAVMDGGSLEACIPQLKQVLQNRGNDGMVLAEVSSELGRRGHIELMIELIAPRYNLEKHGPSAGFNLLQGYLVVGDSAKAETLLATLKALRIEELEENLKTLEQLLSELREAEKLSAASPGGQHVGGPAAPNGTTPHPAPAAATKISLVSISKPIWFYGLEPLAERILPPKRAGLRHVAFAQLSLPNMPGLGHLISQPEEELGRLTRALPLWFAETLFFSTQYTSIAALGVLEDKPNGTRYALFGTEWTTQHLSQLIETNKEPLDYIITGALRRKEMDTELTLRLWDARKLKERKVFTLSWTPETMDAELLRFHETLRTFMECSTYPAGQGLPYSPASVPSAWLDTLGGSASLFLVEKGVLPKGNLSSAVEDVEKAAARAAASNAASLAWITLRRRAEKLGLTLPSQNTPVLATHPLVQQALEVKG